MEHLVPKHLTIDKENLRKLKGINSDLIFTKGTVEMLFLGIPNVTFHIVDSTCGLPCEGIIGSSFLRLAKARLEFHSCKLIVETGEIKFHTRQNISSTPVPDYDQMTITELLDVISLRDTYSVVSLCIISNEEIEQSDKEIGEYDDTTPNFEDYSFDDPAIQHSIQDTLKDLGILNDDESQLDVNTVQIESRLDKLLKFINLSHLNEEELKANSRSSYNSALWVVPKKAGQDGKPRWRVVVDFRPLNEKTIAMQYPMPNIAVIFDQIGSAKYFTVIDCVSGFHQIKMHPSDSHKTAFSTPNGHYEFLRMPFGLRNAAVEYQRAMNFTLEGLIGRGVLVYMDDFIIYSLDLAEHKRLFNAVMEKLRQAEWKLEPTKCELLKRQVNYLGHIINDKGIHPDPQKVAAVQEFPVPKKKEEEFNWDEKCSQAFEALKNLMCNAPVLIYPDFKPFIITTDASGYAIGGILSQGPPGKEQPIAYTSRVLRGPELNYDTYEKEAITMLHAVNMFRPYVYGHQFTMYTDHQPLKKLDNSTPAVECPESAECLPKEQIPPDKLSTDVEQRPTPSPKEHQNQESGENNISTPAPRRSTRSKPWLDEPKISPAPEDKLRSNQPNSVDTNLESSDESDGELEDTPFVKRPRGRLKPPHAPIVPLPAPSTPPPQEQLSDDSGTSDTESEEEEGHAAGNAQIVTCKDSIESWKNILIYFSDTRGKPLDQGGIKLLDKNMIPSKLTVSVGQITKTIKSPSKKRQIYALGLREATPQSDAINIKNLILCLRSLRTELESIKISEFSIAKTNTIDNIEWSKVLNALHDILSSTLIKVIICLGTLTYVNPKDRDDIFYECHNSPMGGHKGVSKTFHRIRRRYYWENLKGDIQRRIQQCLECQLKKLVRVKTKMPMIITDTPGTTFDKIALDIVGPLPPTKKGNAYILTMQDQLSKYCIAAPLPDMKTTTVADAFIKRLVCTFGSPRIIITDQGRNFVSQLMRRVAVRLRAKQVRTSAFHPQSNGSLERSHHALCEYLKIYANSDHQWDDWVELASFNYNTNVQESTKYTPHEVVFGRLARIPSAEPLREADQLPTYEDYIVNLVTKLNDIRKILYDNLISTKQKTKLHYDKHIHPIDFKVGEHIFLLKGIKKGKLDDNHTGPHKILQVFRNNTLKIDIDNKPKIVHANRVKPSHITS
uniref:RNA-directed DNA polymerase n=1 Tax=Trichogramma kaykai TaxID=54128 RepID=A0ABD2W6S4_9HYME